MKNRLVNLTVACLISALPASPVSADFAEEWARRIVTRTATLSDWSSPLHGGSLPGKRIVAVGIPGALAATAGIEYDALRQFPSRRKGRMATPELTFNARGMRSLLEILRKQGPKKGSSKKTLLQGFKSGYYVARTCEAMLEPCPPGYKYIPPAGFRLMYELEMKGGRR